MELRRKPDDGDRGGPPRPDRREPEMEHLQRELEESRARERAARADAEEARRRLSELTAMSRRFASSIRANTGERQRSRRRLAAQYGVSRVLAEARDLDEAAPRVFEILGERLGWDLGVLWTLDREEGALRFAGIWRSSNAPEGGWADAFEAASRAASFRRGIGLPGRVWRRGEPAWVEDVLADEDFVREEAARAGGLRGAFAFPIRDGEFVGVFELFRREVVPPDEDLLQTSALVGQQIGQFVERRHIEAALRESEERYRTLFESIDEGFCVIEMLFDARGNPVDYRFVETNPAFERQTGLRGAAGRRVRELVPDLEEHWFDIYGRIARTRTSLRFVNEAKALNRWFDAYAFPLGEPEDRRVAVLFNDITGRKEAEEALRESERRFRAVVDLVPDLLWRNDPEGHTEWYNRRWTEYTGQPLEEAKGYGWLEAVHPDDREDLLHEFRASIATGAPLLHEHRIRGVDGAYRWFLARAQPLKDESGRTLQWFGAATDVHEQRVALEALRESEERIRAVLEGAPVIVFALDREGTFTLSSGRGLKVLGLEAGEVVGRSVFDVYEDNPGMIEDVRRALGGESFTATWRVGAVGFETHYSPVRGKDGAVEGVIGVSTDVTDRKRAEKERERLLAHEWLSRAQSEERARISRDLHDRVAHSMAVAYQSLQLYEALKERDPDAAGAKLDLARRMARESLESTRNLSMELRRPEAAAGLSSALSNLLKTTVPPGMDSALSVEGDESLVPPGLRGQIYLILREAIRNAVSHARASRLEVRVSIEQDGITGVVEDDGRGFVPEEAPGVGLRSMGERAGLLGGSVGVVSAPGKGARVEVRVPLEGER